MVIFLSTILFDAYPERRVPPFFWYTQLPPAKAGGLLMRKRQIRTCSEIFGAYDIGDSICGGEDIFVEQ